LERALRGQQSPGSKWFEDSGLKCYVIDSEIRYELASDAEPLSVARSAESAVLGSGYTDFNFSMGHAIGVTAGIVISDDSGVHWYVGGGAVEGLSVSITRSISAVTPGLNAGFQVAAFGGSYQIGKSFADNGLFHEFGGGGPAGAALTAYWVSQPVLPPYWVTPWRWISQA
jgi:hypothetical protein